MPRGPVIFLCHSSKDKPFVRKLAQRLNADGIDTWVDEMEVRIGDSIHDRINEGLARSDFLAVVLSRASIASRWVREELNSAASMEKLTRQGVFILPILLERCDIPPLLLDRRYANFTEDDDAAYRELTESIFFHFSQRHPDVELPPIAPPVVDSSLLAQAAERRDILYGLSPRTFEELVALVFKHYGFSVELTPFTRDGGADVVAVKEVSPFARPIRAIVECKRYSPERKVPVALIRQLQGVITLNPADRGVIVTTSTFTAEAKHAAEQARIELIDIDKLDYLLRDIRLRGEGPPAGLEEDHEEDKQS